MSLLVLTAHITAIDADGERTIRSRKFVPVSLASFDKAVPFLAQFPLQAFGHIPNVAANGETMQRIINRQHVFQ